MSDGPGRPAINLTDEQVALIEKLAGYGLTQAQIADCLPMSERTLRNRIHEGNHPEIAAAYARGRAKDAEALSSRHRDIAMGEAGDVPVGDQRKALEWRLERQHKWAQKLELAGDGGGPLQVAVTRRIVQADEDGDG